MVLLSVCDSDLFCLRVLAGEMCQSSAARSRVRLFKGSHMTDLTKSQTAQQPVSVDSSAVSVGEISTGIYDVTIEVFLNESPT